MMIAGSMTGYYILYHLVVCYSLHANNFNIYNMYIAIVQKYIINDNDIYLYQHKVFLPIYSTSLL